MLLRAQSLYFGLLVQMYKRRTPSEKISHLLVYFFSFLTSFAMKASFPTDKTEVEPKAASPKSHILKMSFE